MKKNKTLRTYLKKIYKNKRNQDGAEVGRKINDLMQALHIQNSLTEENRDKDVITFALREITSIRKEKRFREDFPSFAVFSWTGSFRAHCFLPRRHHADETCGRCC